MATNTRPELSPKNEHHIDKERYYELKHFCRQYKTFVQARAALSGLAKRPADLALFSSEKGDPTERCAEARESFDKRITMIERAAQETDPVVGNYILEAVTEGLSYDVLNAKNVVPCQKDLYYKYYREFFWRLSKLRD